MFWVFVAVFFLIKIMGTVAKVRRQLREEKAWKAGYEQAQREAAAAEAAFAAWQAKQQAEWQARKDAARKRYDPYLSALGLKDYPKSLGELKQARRKAMFNAHPDRGGCAGDAVLINNAYTELARRFAA